MAERPDPGLPSAGGPPDEEQSSFPTYEELVNDLLEALYTAGLSIEDLRHELEPVSGERRFECTIRLQPSDPPSRYHAHVAFGWDALMTYISANGPGADCELYHDEDEEAECPHQHLQPQPFVEVEADFILGDGGYELQELTEVTGWVEVVQGVMAKAFPAEERPSVHVGLAALGGVVVVEKLTAEHSWLIDFDKAPDYAGMARQIQKVLRVVPQLADRLPI